MVSRSIEFTTLPIQPILFLHQEIANRQRIHARAHKAADRFVWRADNWFIFVEAGVEHDGLYAAISRAIDTADGCVHCLHIK